MPTIKELRENSGRKRPRVCADLELSERHLTRLEHGHTPLSRILRIAFADYYGVDPDTITDAVADRSAAA